MQLGYRTCSILPVSLFACLVLFTSVFDQFFNTASRNYHSCDQSPGVKRGSTGKDPGVPLTMWYLAFHIVLVTVAHGSTGDSSVFSCCIQWTWAAALGTWVERLKQFFNPTTWLEKVICDILQKKIKLHCIFLNMHFVKTETGKMRKVEFGCTSKYNALPFIPEMDTRQPEETDFGMKCEDTCATRACGMRHYKQN